MDRNDNTIIIDQTPLNLPENPDDLIAAIKGVKVGLNKANKAGTFELRRSGMLNNTMKFLGAIVNEILKSCYNTNGTNAAPNLNLHVPDKKVLILMYEHVQVAIQEANVKGVFETLEESGDLCDHLLTLSNLVNGIVSMIENAELNAKKQQKPDLKSDLISSNSSNNSNHFGKKQITDSKTDQSNLVQTA